MHDMCLGWNLHHIIAGPHRESFSGFVTATANASVHPASQHEKDFRPPKAFNTECSIEVAPHGVTGVMVDLCGGSSLFEYP